MSQTHTILLIDYDPQSIRAMLGPLTQAGYRVEVRNDGESGLEAFHELSPALVVIEPMIPKKHGFQVCMEIKNSPRGRKVPVVIATSFYRGRRHNLEAREKYGCDDYLEKPVAEDLLLERCRRLVETRVEVGAVARTVPVLQAVTATKPSPVASKIKTLEDLSDDEIEASLDEFLLGEETEALEPSVEAEAILEVPIDGRDSPEVSSEPVLQSVAAEAPPLEVEARVESETKPAEVELAVAETEAPTPTRSRLPLWIALAAAACLLAGGAILWSIQHREGEKVPAGVAPMSNGAVIP